VLRALSLSSLLYFRSDISLSSLNEIWSFLRNSFAWDNPYFF